MALEGPQHGDAYNRHTKNVGVITASFAHHFLIPHAPVYGFYTDLDRYGPSLLEPSLRVVEENDDMRRGKRLEPVALRALQEKVAPAATATDQYFDVTGERWLFASPDATVQLLTGERVNVELKAPRRMYAVPKPDHIIQMHLQMHATGTRRSLYGAYVGGRIKLWWVHYDEALMKAILDGLRAAHVRAVRDGAVWTPEDVEKHDVSELLIRSRPQVFGA